MRIAALVTAGILLAGVSAAAGYFIPRDKGKAPAAADLGPQRLAVDEFESKVTPMDATLGDVGLEMRQAAAGLEGNALPAKDLGAMADGWTQQLQGLLTGFKEIEAPPRLEESRALFVYGTATLINAVEALRLASSPDLQEARLKAIEVMKGLQINAFDVVNMAKRELEQEKQRVGLGNPATNRMFIQDPIPLPGVAPTPIVPAPIATKSSG